MILVQILVGIIETDIFGYRYNACLHKLLAFLMLFVKQSEHWNRFGTLDLKNKKGDLKHCNFFRNWRQMDVLQLEIFFFFNNKAFISCHIIHAKYIYFHI